MRRLLLQTLMASIPIIGLASACPVPYYTDMGSVETKSIDPAWKVINVTEGSNTWKYDNTNDNTTSVTEAACGVMYQYDNNNDAADWLISPAISLKAATEYKVSYWIKTASSAEDMDVYLAASSEPEELAAGTVLMSYTDYTDKTWKKASKVFTVSADGDYNIGFFIHSPKARYNVYLRGFTLSENVPVPAKPSGFTAVAAPDEEMKAILSWTLPSLDTDGIPLEENLSGVVVSRDGEEIAVLPGNTETFEDNASTGLRSGFHNYSIYVTYGTQKSTCANASTGYVGPLVPFPLPYTYDFEDEAMWSLWTVIDVADDALPTQNPPGKTWSRWRNTALTGYLAVFSNPMTPAQEDDWLISPPIMFDKPGKYNISFSACVYNGPAGGACRLDVCLGTAPSPEAMTENLSEYQSFKSATYPSSDGERISIGLDITEPGPYYIGMHEHGDAVRRQVRIDDFTVEPDESLIVGVEETMTRPDIHIDGHRISFPFPENTSVFSVAGSKVADYGLTDKIDLSILSPGIYVVRHGKTTLKAIRR